MTIKPLSRFNPKPLARTLALALTAGVTIVIACGPEFPAQLLDDRAATLQGTPANSFAYEASRLVRADDRLAAAVREPVLDGVPWNQRIPEDADPALTRAQRDQLRRMRKQADGDAAYAAGTGLPEAVRLYAAGAVDLHRDDGAQDALERGRARMQAVLDLPPEQGAARAAWAAYALAGLDARPGAARFAPEPWRAVRALVQAGAADPLGLAIASFGEEALLYLDGTSGPCNYVDFMENTSCPNGIAPSDIQKAVQLYAEQAARGSDSGVQSLRFIAGWALEDPARARALVQSTLGQRLLVSYGLARLGDIVDHDLGSAYDNVVNYDATVRDGIADAAQGRGSVRPNPMLVTLVDALLGAGPAGIPDADRVAALAYRVGRYDQAEALAGKLDTALAWWVRAKLAIRRGDMDQAAQAYARAAQAFPQDASLDDANRTLLAGEQGVMALSRGQFVEALDLLYAVSSRQDPDMPYSDKVYWSDTAYVAERVLTTDELRRFVDARAPASPAPPLPDDLSTRGVTDKPAQYALSAADDLRLLLARRLMRDGRYREALPYFPANDDPRFLDAAYVDGRNVYKLGSPRRKAQAYLDARERAHDAWGRATRAQAWFEAAQIARRDGMAIMGSELDPDFAVWDGFLSYGAGRYLPQREGAPAPVNAAQRAELALSGPYITDAERARYAASEPRPYSRYHYREIAASNAVRAADLVMPRSQAYAATLCHAAAYVINDNAPRAQAIYLRYVNNGAYVPFGATFGRDCPAPDFDAASTFVYRQAWARAQGIMARHPWLPAGALALVLGLGAAAVWLTRRARQAR
ncbi:hypothetical protein ACILG0_12285 [Pseudomonadota bacterium AL_CKDN230030165-1A_HGKHYDSX7]